MLSNVQTKLVVHANVTGKPIAIANALPQATCSAPDGATEAMKINIAVGAATWIPVNKNPSPSETPIVGATT